MASACWLGDGFSSFEVHLLAIIQWRGCAKTVAEQQRKQATPAQATSQLGGLALIVDEGLLLAPHGSLRHAGMP